MCRSFVTLCAAAVFALAFVSCSPQPSNDGPPPEVTPEITAPTPSSGKLILPDGSALNPADLRVITNAGEATVGADGSFTAQVIANTPSLTPVVDANDHAVLLGFLSAGTNQTIDAKSTAAALLYFALGGYGVPQGRLSELLDALNKSKATADLAAAITTAIAADPEALLKGNAGITAALAAAQDEILNGNPAAKRAKGLAKLKTRTAVAADVTSSLLTISPVGAQSGVTLTSTEDGSGFNINNTFPRRGQLYVLQTGYTDEQGNDVVLPNPEQIGSMIPLPRASSFDPAAAIDSQLANTRTSSSPWHSGEAGPISLPQHANSTKTTYDLVLLGPALDKSGIPTAFSDPKYVTFRDNWKQQSTELQFESFIFEFMIPLAETTAVGFKVTLVSIPFILPGDSRPAIATTLQQLIEPILQGADVNLDTTDGFKKAIDVILQRAANSADFRDRLIDALIVSYQDQNGQLVSHNFMAANLRRLSELGVLSGAIRGSGNVDLGRLLPSLQGSNKADIWTATVSLVQLTPNEPTVTLDTPSTVFTVAVQGSPAAPLSYNWSTSGAKGHLATALGKDGLSFDTTENQAQYIADPGLIFDGTMDTVTVRVSDANGVFVGSASTHVLGSTISLSTCTNFPEDAYNTSSRVKLTISPRVVVPGHPITCTVSYTFNGDKTDTGVRLLCGHGCGFCTSYRSDADVLTCSCTTDELSKVFANGVPFSVHDYARFEDVASNAKPLLPVAVKCLIVVGVPFDVPPPDSSGKPFKGTLTSTIVYNLSQDYQGCSIGNPLCYCPSQCAGTYDLSDISWCGNFVAATSGNDFAVRAFNLAVETTDRPSCP